MPKPAQPPKMVPTDLSKPAQQRCTFSRVIWCYTEQTNASNHASTRGTAHAKKDKESKFFHVIILFALRAMAGLQAFINADGSFTVHKMTCARFLWISRVYLLIEIKEEVWN